MPRLSPWALPSKNRLKLLVSTSQAIRSEEVKAPTPPSAPGAEAAKTMVPSSKTDTALTELPFSRLVSSPNHARLTSPPSKKPRSDEFNVEGSATPGTATSPPVETIAASLPTVTFFPSPAAPDTVTVTEAVSVPPLPSETV